MPGQGKRKRREAAARDREAARTDSGAGRWEAVLETADRAELRACLRRLREAGVADELMRIDLLCRRPVEHSTYRLSRFVEDTAGVEDRDVSVRRRVPGGWAGARSERG
ncbi:hypothetical protein ACFWIN_05460 [Streptomyces sp. NPDC127049]|uniref:hypothetical protein n=1 Tax=Streptomyces sp. NPDC127049 TaxID=3347118 RepID=UPI0036672F98